MGELWPIWLRVCSEPRLTRLRSSMGRGFASRSHSIAANSWQPALIKTTNATGRGDRANLLAWTARQPRVRAGSWQW